jgi:response regulator of citrate/malate metabolism
MKRTEGEARSMTTRIGVTREELGILRGELDRLVKAILRRRPHLTAGTIAQAFGISESAARRSIARVKAEEAGA